MYWLGLTRLDLCNRGFDAIENTFYTSDRCHDNRNQERCSDSADADDYFSVFVVVSLFGDKGPVGRGKWDVAKVRRCASAKLFLFQGLID